MRWWFLLLALVLLAVVQWIRPLPRPMVVPDRAALSGLVRELPRTAPIRFPPVGEAALAVDGVGILGSSDGNKPQPIASLAKIMTAYVVLQRWPLRAGEKGPSVTITPADVARYRRELAEQQSVVAVKAGEVLNERQLLEALLIPSANNIARVLADHVAGSQAAFVRLMNETARRLGLNHTHYADTSGVSAGTVSTALDQLRLSELAMRLPVFRQIVAMPQVTLPVAGTVYNVNYALGQDGIIGIKTGSTAEAGGCFAFAAKGLVAGTPRLVVGVVLGQQGPSILLAALHEGKVLVRQAMRLPRRFRLVEKGRRLAWLSVPWQSPVPLVAGESVSLVGARGLPLRWSLVPLLHGETVAAGTVVAELRIHLGDQTVALPLRATGAVRPPGLRWRLTRI